MSSSLLVALLAVTLLLLHTTLVAAEVSSSLASVSYVLEPFEVIDPRWFFYPDDSAVANLSISHQDAVRGNGSLHIPLLTGSNSRVEFGWLQDERTMNCHGADYLSLWVKTNHTSGALSLELTLYEDLETRSYRLNQTSWQDLDLYQEYPISLPLDLSSAQEEEQEEDWQEVMVSLKVEDGPLSGLQLHRIRGWSIQVDMASTNSSSTTTTASSIWLDHLACHGNGQLFGNPFYTEAPIANLMSANQGWKQDIYLSDLSRNNTQVSLANGVLTANYTVEQVEAWGGFMAMYIYAPGASYYNLSHATDVAFGYTVQQAATALDRVHARLILVDASDTCGIGCEGDGLDHETWYSFHYILDEQGASGEIQIPLIGSEGAGSPFWLTGWSGVAGNRQFNPDYIKGYTLELNIGGNGDLGTYVQGIVDFYNLRALTVANGTGTSSYSGSEAPSYCRIETEIEVDVSKMIRHEFLASQCCETCYADSDCLYAVASGFDCFTANSLTPQHGGGVPSTDAARYSTSFYWMDDEARRGDFCQVCNCQETTKTIDCRNADLIIVPKTFSQATTWSPRVLDLRNNTNLVLLGGGALDEIADSIEELWLPKDMAILAQESLTSLKQLRRVYFEEEAGQQSTLPYARQNVITDRTEAFGNVCCTPGDELQLLDHDNPNGGATSFTFCNMSLWSPGVDSTYLPFSRFHDAHYLNKLGPNSAFLSEASESVEKCAEACTISAGCNYYFYDARIRETDHTCHLLTDKGQGLGNECCNPRQFADEEMTLPGQIAGLPPRTRHIDDNARVVILEGKNLILDDSNGYQSQFKLALGSTPTRGAVWITPLVLSTLTNMQVEISPRRIALYDENRTAAVKVRVLFPDEHAFADASSTNFVIRDEIESCDQAFTSSLANTEATIFVDVLLPTKKSSTSLSFTAIGLICAGVIVAALVLGLSWVVTQRKKRQNDSVWMVRSKDLRFDDPPEILGRGTFGMVLAAEYRGTRVAVKRVIPKPARKPERPGCGRKSEGYYSAGSSSIFDEGHSSFEKENSASSAREGDIVASLFKHSSVVMGNQTDPDATSHTTSTKETRHQQVLWNKLKNDFIREMRHLSKLRHPCVTTVMGAVIESGAEPTLVMELMDHGSLYDLLHNHTVIIEGEMLLPILRDVTQGMRFLHAANPQVIHGDLKAGNILVDCKFRSKIADFGLSQKKYISATGTPYWMAPELLRGVATNTYATDVYSFGIVLYEVYSRKDPYEGEDFDEVIRLITDRSVNKRPPVPPNMPNTVESIMMDCLREDPGARPTFRKLDQWLNEINSQSVEPTNEAMTRQWSARSLIHRQSLSLYDMFPPRIAKALEEGRRPEAERHDMVTIFFCDVVGFTKLASSMDPQKVAEMLGRLYSAFDELADKHDIYKVDTIGDAYMCATNLVKDQSRDHVARIARFAVEAIEAAKGVQIDLDDPSKGFLEIRAGFNSGPCVADVLGTKSPVFTLFGDTVNTASRMESSGEKNRIHCSKASAHLLMRQLPGMPLKSRGLISIKGKGEEHTYWVNESCSVEELARRDSSAAQVVMDSPSARLSECAISEESQSDMALSMAESGEASTS